MLPSVCCCLAWPPPNADLGRAGTLRDLSEAVPGPLLDMLSRTPLEHLRNGAVVMVDFCEDRLLTVRPERLAFRGQPSE